MSRVWGQRYEVGADEAFVRIMGTIKRAAQSFHDATQWEYERPPADPDETAPSYLDTIEGVVSAELASLRARVAELEFNNESMVYEVNLADAARKRAEAARAEERMIRIKLACAVAAIRRGDVLLDHDLAALAESDALDAQPDDATTKGGGK